MRTKEKHRTKAKQQPSQEQGSGDYNTRRANLNHDNHGSNLQNYKNRYPDFFEALRGRSIKLKP